MIRLVICLLAVCLNTNSNYKGGTNNGGRSEENFIVKKMYIVIFIILSISCINNLYAEVFAPYNSPVFHEKGCADLPPNERLMKFPTIQSALKSGASPCGSCINQGSGNTSNYQSTQNTYNNTIGAGHSDSSTVGICHASDCIYPKFRDNLCATHWSEIEGNEIDESASLDAMLAIIEKKEKQARQLEDAKEEVRNNPDVAWAHNNLGNAYDELGKFQEAIESYKQTIRIDPDYVDAHYNLGLAYYKSHKYKEAIKSFKQAISIDPRSSQAHYGLGLAYYDSGYYEAIGHKQAIRIDPDYRDAHYNLGIAYLMLKDRGSAIEQYKILKRFNSELANKLFDMIYE